MFNVLFKIMNTALYICVIMSLLVYKFIFFNTL